jgi:hypothetical protein
MRGFDSRHPLQTGNEARIAAKAAILVFLLYKIRYDKKKWGKAGIIPL